MEIDKDNFCDQDCKTVLEKYLGDGFDTEAAFAEIELENEGRVVFSIIIEWLLRKYIEKEIKAEKEMEENEEEKVKETRIG